MAPTPRSLALEGNKEKPPEGGASPRSPIVVIPDPQSGGTAEMERVFSHEDTEDVSFDTGLESSITELEFLK